MSEDGGEGEIVVPPTIQALLQSRLDRLGARRTGHDRARRRRGAGVPPRHRAGARACNGARRRSLPPPVARAQGDDPARPADVPRTRRRSGSGTSSSATLPTTRCRRRPARSSTRRLPAGWISTRRLVEQDEIVGYHLECAYRNRAELDRADPRLGELGRRAATELAAAARGAVARGDLGAACGLLERAAGMLSPDDPQRLETALALCYPLIAAGRSSDARAFAAELTASPEPRFHVLGQLCTCRH